MYKCIINKIIELQDHGKVKSKDLFRLGGQRWREMSSEEKMPYIKAAKLVKQQSQHNNKSEQMNKTNGDDFTKKSENQKDQKKKEREVYLLISFSLVPYFSEQN